MMITIAAALAGFGFGLACGLGIALWQMRSVYRDIREGRLRQTGIIAGPPGEGLP